MSHRISRTVAAGGAQLPRPTQRKAPSIREVICDAAAQLANAGLVFGHGTDNATDEAAYLVRYALKLPIGQTERCLDRTLNAQEARLVHQIIGRRINERCPAPYLTHEAWLGRYRFYVDERVIVPRSYLAEWIRDGLDVWIPQPRRIRNALELCTGSGCLAVLLAKALPHARVDATDISTDALAVARRNIARYRLGRRVRLIHTDLFPGLKDNRYDLIIANPPYVTSSAMARLPAEYRCEPALALAGGSDGLDFLRRILAQAPSQLRPEGLLVVEVGHARKRVERVYPRTPFTWIETSAGDDAVFLLRRDEIPRAAARWAMH